MKLPKWLMALVLLPAFHVASPANAARIEPWNKPCLNDYRTWKKKPSHKAVAVTKVYSDGQGCGMSWSASSPRAARAEALRRCQKRLKQRHPKAHPSSCVVIQVK